LDGRSLLDSVGFGVASFAAPVGSTFAPGS
jgi:hypothetical protein